MELTKEQAAEVASAILHKIGCCSFITDLSMHIEQTENGWDFRSPERKDLEAKDGAVMVRISNRGTWEGHNYQLGDNAQGTFSFSAGKLAVSVQEQ